PAILHSPYTHFQSLPYQRKNTKWPSRKWLPSYDRAIPAHSRLSVLLQIQLEQRFLTWDVPPVLQLRLYAPLLLRPKSSRSLHTNSLAKLSLRLYAIDSFAIAAAVKLA